MALGSIPNTTKSKKRDSKLGALDECVSFQVVYESTSFNVVLFTTDTFGKEKQKMSLKEKTEYNFSFQRELKRLQKLFCLYFTKRN